MLMMPVDATVDPTTPDAPAADPATNNCGQVIRFSVAGVVYIKKIIIQINIVLTSYKGAS